MSRSEAEKSVGIGWYATTGTPCPARVKASEEDFMVEEVLELEGLSEEERRDYYPLYRVEKRSVDTLHMAKELSAALKSRVSYGGLKDKRASAVQYVTPTSLRSERPSEVSAASFTARLVGYLPRPVSRRAVTGNRFDVVLRECCARVGEAVEEALDLAGKGRVPNYYGLQRFGSLGTGTHLIGKAIVKQDFQEAVNLMLMGSPQTGGDDGEATGSLKAAGHQDTGLLPPGRDVERRVARQIERNRGDWVGALRAVPIELRRLYVHAYQSVLFNKTLSLALSRGEDISVLKAGDNWAQPTGGGLTTTRVMGVRDEAKQGAVPMVQVPGYAFRDYGSRFDSCLVEVLRAEGVHPREFYVDAMQEVSAEGGFRRPHLAILDASSHVGEGTARMKFTLAKGQYATVLLREVVKPADPGAVGLA